MDKLEIALEKARQMRQQTLASASPTKPVQKPFASVVKRSPQTPRSDTLESNKIIQPGVHTVEADAFRLLRTQILQSMERLGARTIAITSPNYGDGKTTISLNLALSIAQDIKQTVLIVDLDLRKPCLHRYLGLSPRFGLTDYLTSDVPLSECLVRLPFDRITTLPSGGILPNSSEFLGSPKMAALASELKARYPDRIIIYDMPPILTQDDSITFMPNVDCALLVVRNGGTTMEDLKRCKDALNHATLIGTVLNNVQKV